MDGWVDCGCYECYLILFYSICIFTSLSSVQPPTTTAVFLRMQRTLRLTSLFLSASSGCDHFRLESRRCHGGRLRYHRMISLRRHRRSHDLRCPDRRRRRRQSHCRSGNRGHPFPADGGHLCGHSSHERNLIDGHLCDHLCGHLCGHPSPPPLRHVSRIAILLSPRRVSSAPLTRQSHSNWCLLPRDEALYNEEVALQRRGRKIAFSHYTK